MPVNVVYDSVVAGQPDNDGIFAGKKFWLSGTVPQKTRFVQEIKSNGGEVVPLEKQANICLYDHVRKNPPPGMYSYRFVEYSVKNGELEDLEEHKIGGLPNRAARTVGSVRLPSKKTRTPYTLEDDRILWKWMQPHKGLRGDAGNALFQELENINPRHTYQSWRDRWLKYVQHNPWDDDPSLNEPDPEPPSPLKKHTPAIDRRERKPETKPSRVIVDIPVGSPSKEKRKRLSDREPVESNKATNGYQRIDSIEHSPGREASPRKRQRVESNRSSRRSSPSKRQSDKSGSTKRSGHEKISESRGRDQLMSEDLSPSNEEAGSWEFSEKDEQDLLRAAGDILDVHEDEEECWELLAKGRPEHTAEQWKTYFHDYIKPKYLKIAEKSGTKQDLPTRAIQEPHVTKQPDTELLILQRESDDRPAASITPDSTSSEDSSTHSYSTGSTIQPHTEEHEWQPERPSTPPVAKSASLEIADTPESVLPDHIIPKSPGTPTPKAERRSLGLVELTAQSVLSQRQIFERYDQLPLPGQSSSATEHSRRQYQKREARANSASIRLFSDTDQSNQPTSPIAESQSGIPSSRSSSVEFDTAADFSRLETTTFDVEGELETFETAAEVELDRFDTAREQQETIKQWPSLEDGDSSPAQLTLEDKQLYSTAREDASHPIGQVEHVSIEMETLDLPLSVRGPPLATEVIDLTGDSETSTSIKNEEHLSSEGDAFPTAVENGEHLLDESSSPPNETSEHLSDEEEMLDLTLPSPDGGWSAYESGSSPLTHRNVKLHAVKLSTQPEVQSPEVERSESHRSETHSLESQSSEASDLRLAMESPELGDPEFRTSSSSLPITTPPFYLRSSQISQTPRKGTTPNRQPSSPLLPPSDEPIPCSPSPVHSISDSDLSTDIPDYYAARAHQGWDSRILNLTLRATCFRMRSADAVYSKFLAAGGMPDKEIRHVWTEQDDADLDAEELERLRKKHGKRGIKLRRSYLAMIAEMDGGADDDTDEGG